MKTVLFLTSFLVFGFFASTQQTRYNNSTNYNGYTVPRKVQQGWHRDHPNASDPNWQKNGRQWDANYQDQENHRNVQTCYNRRGKMIDKHTDWDRNDFPKAGDNWIRNRYHTGDYTVTRIDRPNSSSLFQILLNSGSGRKTIYMDQNGNEVRYRDRH